MAEDYHILNETISYGIQTRPVRVLDGVAAVDVGGYCAGALKTDDSLWMWGGSLYGELGDGNSSMHVCRVPKKLMDGVAAFSVGEHHAAAIKTDGSLWMWGSNEKGQLGVSGGNYTFSFHDESAACQAVPVKVMDGVAAVSCGRDHTVAVKTDGSLWAWGDNTFGELGNGQIGGTGTPKKVMEDVAAVSAGNVFTAAIDRKGDLWMWGSNLSGALGNSVNATDQHGTPCQTVPLKIMEHVAAASAGINTLAVQTDGSVWTWGSNYAGQLGNGTTEKTSTPGKIMDGAATAQPTYSVPGEGQDAGNQTVQPSIPNDTPSFSDIKESDWFYPYVTELVRIGGVSGYTDGTFRPSAPISLSEACAILLGSFPVDGAFEQSDIDRVVSQAEQINGAYWANPHVARAALCGIEDFGMSASRWNQPATREELAYLIFQIYSHAQLATGENTHFTYYDETYALVGDYASSVSGSDYEPYILWMYGSGIIVGVNERGDFQPKSTASRAEYCTMVASLLHPENWKEIDWDGVVADLAATASQTGTRLTDGVDFTGKGRIRYDIDVAYGYCRTLENDIGIQIFYLPEWTERENGSVQYSDINQLEWNKGYFEAVLTELKKMRAAYDRYPQGFLKEVVQKKGSRSVEIILCPYTYEGLDSFGLYVYDDTGNSKKVDQIYYTGSGDSQYYSHEMGHMVMSAAALNGRTTTCETWDSLSTGGQSYVSLYAMSNRAEDWAETWAYLWHRTDAVINQCRDEGLKAKVRYMSEILDRQYDTITAAELPWASVLG